jgi:hypothetical protein
VLKSCAAKFTTCNSFHDQRPHQQTARPPEHQALIRVLPEGLMDSTAPCHCRKAIVPFTQICCRKGWSEYVKKTSPNVRLTIVWDLLGPCVILAKVCKLSTPLGQQPFDGRGRKNNLNQQSLVRARLYYYYRAFTHVYYDSFLAQRYGSTSRIVKRLANRHCF